MMKKAKMLGFLMTVFVSLSFVVADPAAYAKGGGGGGGGHSSGGFSGGGSKSYGGGGGFSGGYKSSSPSLMAKSSGGFSGGSKPSAPAPAAKSSGGFSGGSKYTAPAPAAKSSGGFSGGPKSPAPTSLAKAAVPQKDAAAMAKTKTISKEQSQKAMADYKSQQSKYKYTGSPVNASPTTTRYVTRNVYVNNYHYTPAGYAYRQKSFYGNYGWGPPVYGYGFHPYYGMWNTNALWFMLYAVESQRIANQQQYAMMYYSHRNDPDMMAWRQKAEIEAQTNADLRRQLATMDQRVQAMEQQGVQADPGYVPPDMKDVALSEETLKNAEQQTQSPQVVPAVYNQPAPPEKKSHWILWTLLGAGVLVIGGYLLFGRKY
jgi:hypothetical protein